MEYWNYRVIKKGDGYYVGEVYYDHDGRVSNWTYSSYNPLSDHEDVDELKSTVRKILAALDKPVLVWKSDGGKDRLEEE